MMVATDLFHNNECCSRHFCGKTLGSFCLLYHIHSMINTNIKWPLADMRECGCSNGPQKVHYRAIEDFLYWYKINKSLDARVAVIEIERKSLHTDVV